MNIVECWIVIAIAAAYGLTYYVRTKRCECLCRCKRIGTHRRDGYRFCGHCVRLMVPWKT